MAKSYKELLGKTDLRDVNRMSIQELRQATRTLSDVANKRLSNLEKQSLRNNLYSPAYENVMSKGRFSTKGKSKEDLAKEFMRARNFLQQKTSTVKGAKQFAQDTKSRLGTPDLSNTELKKVWELYEEFADEITVRNKGSLTTQREIAQMVSEGKSREEIKKSIQLGYEEKEQQYLSDNDYYNGLWDDIEDDY